MTNRFDGGDESRVQALMAENQRLREHIHDEEHFDVPMDECHQCAAVEAYFAGPANV